MNNYKPCAMCKEMTLYTRLHKRPYEGKSKVCVGCFNELVSMQKSHEDYLDSKKRESDCFYGGFIRNSNGDLFWKQGITCEPSMYQRYASKEYSEVYPVFFYEVGKNVSEIESELINEMPSAISGVEWYYAGSGDFYMSKVHNKLKSYGVNVNKEKDYSSYKFYLTLINRIV